MAEKLFYSMGDIAEMFDVNQSLIRHWESQFSVLRPKRNKKGNRLFSPRDVENLKLIYHLVKERGMTLEGAKRAMRNPVAETGVERDAELMERLQHIRSLLVEVREDLKVGATDILPSDDPLTEPEVKPIAASRGKKKSKTQSADSERPVTKQETASEQVAASASSTASASDASAASEQVAEGEVAAKAKPTRKPRRKKEDVENKELFAFYEQSLF